MTKDEIKTLIAEKISGQGNQVDIGGALADVLNELVDASGGGGVPEPVSGIQISAGAAATSEQIAQIKSNYLAGQNTILSTTNQAYTVMLFESGPCVLFPDEEDGSVHFWFFEEL